MNGHASDSESGWQVVQAVNTPLALRQFILKLHSRCNLACDYCYVYTMADQRWRSRPRAMSAATMLTVARRIAEHVHAHGLSEIEVVLHGGEPLLAGIAAIEHCVLAVRRAVGSSTRVRVTMQTNGLLLDRPALVALDELGVHVSVSLDGGQAAQDRHRRTADGRSSYSGTARRLRELMKFPAVYAGLLCTVDVRNHPTAVYESLLEFAPPAVDFLLPHGNWSNPPPLRDPASAETPYADWLIEVFDRWYDAPRRETGVRLFDELLSVVLGGRSRVEGVGLSPARMVVVETDGAVENSDVLASTFSGAAATGLHVIRDPFDAVLRLPGVAARQQGVRGLPTRCRSCPIRRDCGGGLPAHRYDTDGFDHPSVYCRDLFALVAHIRQRVATDLARLGRPS